MGPPLIMSAILTAVLSVGVVLFLAGGAAALVGGLRRRGQPAPAENLSPEHSRAARLMFRSEARAATAALAAAAGAGALMWELGRVWTTGYGLPSALAAAVAALAGLLVFSLHPRRKWPAAKHGVVVADLMPRGPTSFAARWVFVPPLLAAAVLLLGLLLTGLYSATDENGLHRVFLRRSLSGWGVEDGQIVDVQYNVGSTGPFPGWYYGVPLMICTVLLVVEVHWSLRRTAHAPRPGVPELFPADSRLRSRRTTFIMSASSAALAFQSAGLGLIAGDVLRSAHLDAIPSADLYAAAGSTPVQPGYGLALALIATALVIAAAALVLLSRALSVVTSLWAAGGTAGRRVAEPAL